MASFRASPRSSSGSTIKFNVGGTKHEVSRSLLDRYPESMLTKLCSKTWQDGVTRVSTTATATTEATTTTSTTKEVSEEGGLEIFIDRNGERFQYILDYMRDAHVELPRSIPRGQFITDLEYFGLDYTDDSVTLSLANPRDLIYSIERHEDYFENKSNDIERRYRSVAAERMALAIEREYFKLLVRNGSRDSAMALSVIEPISEPPVMMGSPNKKQKRNDKQQRKIVEVTVKSPLSHTDELNEDDLQKFLTPVGLLVEHVKYKPSYRIPSSGEALVGLSIL